MTNHHQAPETSYCPSTSLDHSSSTSSPAPLSSSIGSSPLPLNPVFEDATVEEDEQQPEEGLAAVDPSSYFHEEAASAEGVGQCTNQKLREIIDSVLSIVEADEDDDFFL